MKPEERPGLGRKIVVTDEGIDPAVIEAIDKTPAEQKIKEASGRRGATCEAPDEEDKPVPEFVPTLACDD
jgi:hypothetical protein